MRGRVYRFRRGDLRAWRGLVEAARAGIWGDRTRSSASQITISPGEERSILALDQLLERVLRADDAEALAMLRKAVEG